MKKQLATLLVIGSLAQFVPPAWAQNGTTTTLSATPAGTQAPSQIITFQAAVADSTGAVTHGSVSFYDGSKLLHTSQLVSLASGGYTPGSATYRTKLTVGTHLISAKFLGTSGEHQSASTQVTIQISGLEPSMTTLTETGAPGTYQLSATTFGFGRTPPSGSIGIVDTLNNSVLATSSLNAGSPPSAFVQTPFASPDLEVSNPIITDVDGDGIPDVAFIVSGDTLVVYLGKGDGTFAAPKSSPLGSSSSTFNTMAFGDLDGDGIIDCVVGSNSANAAVLFGKGDGTFGTPQTITAGSSNASGIVIGDFNGDGFPDIAVSQLAGTVTVLLGSASGTYTASAFAVPIQPTSIQAVDLNNDEKLDLVTFPLVTMLGKGDGTFTVVNSLSGLSDSYVNQLVIADINGDGIPDFIIAQNATGYLQVRLGKGDGTFGNPVWSYQDNTLKLYAFDFATFAGSPSSGLITFFVNPTTNATTMRTFASNGDGTFGAPVSTPHSPSQPFFADLNGDGITDIVNVHSNADGTFPAYGQFTTELAASLSNTGVFTPGLSAGSPAVVEGQYAGDGTYSASVSPSIVLQGATSISLTVTPSSVPPGGIATFNAKIQDSTGAPVTAGTVSFYDGGTILGTFPVGTAAAHAGIASYVTSTLAIGAHSITARYFGAGVYGNSISSAQSLSISGKYTTTTSLKSTGTSGSYTLTSSVSGLGFGSPTGTVTFTDVSTGTVLGTLQLPASSGNPNYAVTGSLTNGTALGNPLVADFNGDGISDVAVSGSSAISVFLGRADGTFGAPNSVGGQSSNLVAGDFNGDGILDLAAQNNLNGSVQVLLGKGDGTFQPPITGISLPVGEVSSMAVGDFNQDGHLDIAVVDALNSTLEILAGNGDGTFKLLATYTASGGLASVVTGDLNGDGKLDLICEDNQGGSVRVLLGRGDGTFLDAGFAPFSGVVESPSLAYVNADGFLDILAVDSLYTSTLDVALGAGDGSFAAAKMYGVDTACSAGCGGGLTTLDLNNDGITDVALTDNGAGTLTLLTGKGDGTFSLYSTVPAGQSPDSIATAYLAPGSPALVVDSASGSISLVTAYPNLSDVLSSITASGSDQVHATYSGDMNFLSSSSPVIILDGKLPASATLVFSLGGFSSAISGTAIPVKVTVGGSGTSTPTGSVQLYDSGSPIGSAVTLFGGQASFITSGLLSVGARSVTVLYSGDSLYNPATSPAVTVQVVAVGADSLSLTTSSATTQYSGVTIPISGVLSISSLGVNPTGTLTLYDGSTLVATSTLSGIVPVTASFNVNTSAVPLSAGSHNMSLRYSGDSNWASAISTNLLLTINAPDFSINTGSNPASLTIAKGSSGTLGLAIAPSGSFSGTIALSCSGNPSETTCSISPSSLVNGGTATLTVTTTAAQASIKPPGGLNRWLGSGSLALAFMVFFIRRRKVKHFGILIACAGSLFWISGCGGGSTSPSGTPNPGTPTGQSTLIVTATSGSISHTIPIQLTVN